MNPVSLFPPQSLSLFFHTQKHESSQYPLHPQSLADEKRSSNTKSSQHYELYYFIVNKTLGPTNVPLFDYASTPPSLSTSSSSSRPPPEGASADPNFTKVVDRRWYERNKHIFPASVWENFDPGRDYGKGKRSDAEGNAFFFS